MRTWLLGKAANGVVFRVLSTDSDTTQIGPLNLNGRKEGGKTMSRSDVEGVTGYWLTSWTSTK